MSVAFQRMTWVVPTGQTSPAAGAMTCTAGIGAVYRGTCFTMQWIAPEAVMMLEHWMGTIVTPGPAPKERRKAFTTFVDVRDVAEFAVRCVADGHGGTFNVTGPEGLLTFDEMVDGCKACTSKPVEFVPAPELFLLEHGVSPWMGLPLWLPEDPQFAGAGTVSRARAVAAGCTFRPLADTVRDTLAWWAKERKDAFPFGAKPGAPGLSLEREAELVAKLRA